MLVTGVVINLLNPKLTLFFFAFLPQFVSPGDPDGLLRMAELSGVFMLLTRRPRILAWMRRTFAAAFVALGLRLALERR